MLSETQMTDEMVSDEYLVELITKFISKDLPQVVKDKLLRDMRTTGGDVSAKLSKLSAELREFVGKGLVSKNLDDILKNSFFRAKLFTGYRLKMKNKLKQKALNLGKKFLQMNGKLLIIKPNVEQPKEAKDNKQSTATAGLDIDGQIDRIKDSYFLPDKGLEGKLNFKTVDDNPNDLSFDRIADSINEFLETDYNAGSDSPGVGASVGQFRGYVFGVGLSCGSRLRTGFGQLVAGKGNQI
ncbi:unnamed protein product [Medioppia subpectinata]|uniref:Uncharacterized protein n=1 Tax=Medioppia subpectinata TaxID=1979941 RepID=A0A7R9QB62_9ACAR|nr:unnamed protein product [Medioppia subpectinata]CAG2117772.1 unnamed protein product [Medioppia subpectinata]